MEITEELSCLIYYVHVAAAINVTQVVAKRMIDSGSGGSVVNISSMTARKLMPTTALCCSSKAALEMLTKSMAVELGPHNIRVNCIVPGKVNTPMAAGAGSMGTDLEYFVQSLSQRLKSSIETNEIADLIMFLLSPLASMIIGESVAIDGARITNYNELIVK